MFHCITDDCSLAWLMISSQIGAPIHTKILPEHSCQRSQQRDDQMCWESSAVGGLQPAWHPSEGSGRSLTVEFLPNNDWKQIEGITTWQNTRGLLIDKPKSETRVKNKNNESTFDDKKRAGLAYGQRSIKKSRAALASSAIRSQSIASSSPPSASLKMPHWSSSQSLLFSSCAVSCDWLSSPQWLNARQGKIPGKMGVEKSKQHCAWIHLKNVELKSW